MSRECECKEASVEPKYQQSITISMEEYKELLIIKGKYEELKSQQGYLPGKPTITYTCGTGNAGLEYTYKVTY